MLAAPFGVAGASAAGFASLASAAGAAFVSAGGVSVVFSSDLAAGCSVAGGAAGSAVVVFSSVAAGDAADCAQQLAVFMHVAAITAAANIQLNRNRLLLSFIFHSSRPQMIVRTTCYDLVPLAAAWSSSSESTRAIADMFTRNLVPVASSTRIVSRSTSRCTLVTTP